MVNCDAQNLTELRSGALQAGDWTVVVLYFLFCIIVGLYSLHCTLVSITFITQSTIASWKTNRSGTTKEYFLAGEKLVWWSVGASLFASNIGSEHFVGLAGQAASYGISVGAYEWQAIWIVLLLGWFFMPVYKASGVSTMPQYLERRYGNPHLRSYLTVLSLFIYILTKISVDLYAGDVFLEEAFGLNVYAATAILLLITGLYTLFGGLSAVVYTEVLQTGIMIIGASILAIIGFVDVGGMSGLEDKYLNLSVTKCLNNNSDAKISHDDAFSIVRSASVRTPDLPWPGVFFSLPITSIFYWCSDQVIVQRVLGSKDINHARAGTVMAGYLKILPMFLMVFPGMISRVLYPKIVGADGCSNLAYPTLVLKLMPHGLTGLMLAVMMAALMSSLASTFNSSSTLFTLDVWLRYRSRLGGKPSERELLIVGRLVVIVMVVISVIWVPIVDQFQSGLLFNYIQTISSYLQPPVTAVFLSGLLWKGATDWGAFAALLVGLIVGVTRLILDFVYPFPQGCDFDTRPAVLKINYLYFTIILFFISLIVLFVVSLLTQNRARKKNNLAGVTWWTRHEKYIEQQPEDRLHLAEQQPSQENANLNSQSDVIETSCSAPYGTIVNDNNNTEQHHTETTSAEAMEIQEEVKSSFQVRIGKALWHHLKGWLFGHMESYQVHENIDDDTEESPEWGPIPIWSLRAAVVLLLATLAVLWGLFW